MFGSAITQSYYPQWLPGILDAQLQFVGKLFGQNWHLPYNPELLLILWALTAFGLITLAAKVAAVFMVLMERKVLAWMTQRKGPNRVGPWGLFQTIADGVKLLFKEDIMAKNQDKLLFTLGPAIFFIPSFALYALVPFSDKMVAVALPAGALFIFALSSISGIGMVLSGWASNNKYSLIGGMRSAAQAISYEIPLILSVLGVVLFAGTMNIAEIVQAQNGNIFSWYWLSLTPVGFVIFFIASMAELNRVPFDLPEAEQELVSGYNTEYSGMKFAMFFLAEYAALFAMSGFTTAFFFGGYYSPLGFFLMDKLFEGAAFHQLVLQIEMLFWFLLKTYVFIFIAMWWRATLPRLKPDQLMGFSWKFLLPLALINVFVITILKYVTTKVLPPEWTIAEAFVPLAGWLIFAGVAFGGFFYLSSHLLNKKLEARLANR